MGFFYETKPSEPEVARALSAAYAADRLDPDQARRAAAGTISAIRAETERGGLKVERLIASMVIFGLLVGVATESTGLSGSSQALYGFAGSVFGVVVGFLGSEKSGGA
jgi:hypothetical protein